MMTLAIVLTLKRMVPGALCVAALAAVGCADERRLPTGPSAAAAVSGLSGMVSGEAASSVSVSSARSGELHVRKECSEHTGLPGAFCTITSSNLAAIEVGSKVIYASADTPEGLDSDVVLDPPGPGNNRAFGHCTLNASVSRCTFSGGTGKFTHFSADVAVSHLGGADFGWEGTYSFSPRD